MKLKLAALAMMGGVLASGPVLATEGNQDAAKAIAQIEARRTAKTEAQVRSIKEYGVWGARNEAGERREARERREAGELREAGEQKDRPRQFGYKGR